MPLNIWTNQPLSPDAEALLRQELEGHHLTISSKRVTSNVHAPEPDPDLAKADVAFGQPHPDDLAAAPGLRLVQLSSAGYTRYDSDDVRTMLKRNNTPMCNASGVYDDPCAQHVLAMILAESRQLPQAFAEANLWKPAPLRANSWLLMNKKVVIVGYGAIGQRLARLLQPFGCKVVGLRRSVQPDAPFAEVQPIDQADTHLADADVVVNILPAHATTENFFDRSRMGGLKKGVVYVSVGRGDTTDQDALIEALKSGRLQAAYLDVTTPEPLPADHPLWTTPRCYITPHIAGGTADEFHRLVRHLVLNIRRLEQNQPLVDQIA